MTVKMYESDRAPDDSERTAFRRAEKKYKLYYNHTNKKSSKGQRQPKKVELSEVVDFKSVLESFNQNGETPPGIFKLRCDSNLPVFGIENRPGFYFIPGSLSIEEQQYWIKESLTSFPQPPNRTNHNAVYGPIPDLFIAAKNKKVWVEVKNSVKDVSGGPDSGIKDADGCKWQFSEETVAISKGQPCKSIAASVLLRKLRWSTLGLQFDWSKVICLGVTSMTWKQIGVNLYLGCKAIFLLGGKSREDDPIAMFVRSGDIVLMAGEARECFHGVPRIFTDNENAEITHLAAQFSRQDDVCFLEYIRTSRININIRQVF
ncbi:PREDICTED: alpha-ketoglutarate-dependent dioxygenase alkB isoform X3 [Nelumbo nucifera]|uniref:Alpha-ketoglutarate-dependent dioxygenase alkB isoform X3 n=1 Tax=Nelumbo nucifera TaxID=4432 RepID=A0A1U7ZM62_NELNU|nr:PREDICTED: alpha-ketoglutarate-dependent dioxygenase alkB isoform X3 [Nelumbo nucifera]